MSHDPLHSPEPNNSEPIDSESTGSESRPIAEPRSPRRRSQSGLKAQTIRLLRTTIQALETVADKLEAAPVGPSPIERVQGAVGNTLSQARSQLVPLGQRVKNVWTPILQRVRGLLPASLRSQLSDRALTGALAGVLVLVVWATSSLLSKPPQPTIVATAPSPTPTTQPSPAPSTQPGTEPTAQPTTPSTAPDAPPIAQAPPAPAPKPSPAPPLKLTPEQALIAAIQDQVADISNQYLNGLIQSVQANFRSSRLLVTVGQGWYELSRSQQDKLANEVLRRAQDLDFSKLEITDAAGVLLARSPVVGSEMVILKRSQDGVELS